MDETFFLAPVSPGQLRLQLYSVRNAKKKKKWRRGENPTGESIKVAANWTLWTSPLLGLLLVTKESMDIMSFNVV